MQYVHISPGHVVEVLSPVHVVPVGAAVAVRVSPVILVARHPAAVVVFVMLLLDRPHSYF